MLLIDCAAWEISFRKQSGALRVVTRHQYGIFALIADSISRENSCFLRLRTHFNICNAAFLVVSRLFCFVTFSFFKFLQGEHTGERLITQKVINFLRLLKFSNFDDDGSENATFIHSVSLIFSTSFNWLNVSEFSSG